jgi:hypothetical protein
MSSAALVMLSRQFELSSKKTSKGLRVNQPGDAFEQEADRVANTVSAGGHIPGWSLASAGVDQIQRDSTTASSLPASQPIRQVGDPQDPPAPNNYGDMLGKLAEAFLQTSAGKTIVKYLTDQPIVQDAKDFVETPQGVVVAGGTAIAAISGLAAAHKGIPIQIPAIPLDKLHPGLKMKIDVEGPLDHPTQGSLMFSFEGAPPKKKKGALTDKERFQTETERIAENQRKFRAGMAPQSQGPLASPAAQQQQADEQLARKAELRRLSNILQSGGTHKPGEFTPLVPSTQPQSLRMRDPDLIPSPDATKKEKREEIPVQLKADSAYYNDQEAAPEVESVISSSGRPLDRETRRYMESRIGFDFSKVRIHTDSRAAASAKSLGARAYTVGNNIVFGPGRFAPNTTEGRRLLAHELAHVVQQGASAGKVHKPIAPPAVVTPAPHQIQRDADEDSKGISLWDLTTDFRGTLKKIATKIPGYKLFTVIIAYDPLAGQEVTRNANNLIGEFLKLVGAEKTFKDLQESQAIDKAFDWLSQEINKLNLSVQTLKDLVSEAIENGVKSITGGVQATLRAVYETFKPTLERVKTFAANVLTKVGEFLFEGALKLIGGTGVLEILHDAGAAISAVFKDPVGFLGHLVDALKKGFNQFSSRIVDHLKEAILSWLFGALGNIQIPKTLTLGSVFNLVLQVLGLDYRTNIRPKLVTALGGETPVKIVEGGVAIITTIATQGLGAAWDLILKQAGDLLESFLAAARDWAITTVVQVAIVKLVTLFNPAGAVIQAIQAIYTTLKVFIEKAKEIAALIKAISVSIAKIAAGDIAAAADYIEGVMAKSIPIMISFLADYLGLGNVAKTIRDILNKLKAKIGAGVDKVIQYLVDKGKALLALGKETVAKVLDWWKQRKEITQGTEQHAIYMDGSEDQAKLMVASFPAIPWNEFLDEKLKTATPAQKTGIEEIRVKATELEKRLPPSKDENEKAVNVEAKRKLFEEVADKIAALGLHRDVKDPASLINYKPVRAEDDGGTGMTGSVLTPSHPPGSEPADEPRIWKSLGSLVAKKSYVQGHLLNENLGGPGRRFNLTPINKKANANHLSMIERTVKKAVNTDKKVMSYTVDVVYGSHPSKPKRMLELESLAANSKLGPGEPEELKEFQGEQKLCTQFSYEAHELEHNGTEWVPKKGSTAEYKGQVDNTIAL